MLLYFSSQPKLFIAWPFSDLKSASQLIDLQAIQDFPIGIGRLSFSTQVFSVPGQETDSPSQDFFKGSRSYQVLPSSLLLCILRQ
jgi:hypothetical protein